MSFFHKEALLTFLSEHNRAVIASSDHSGQPYTSVIFYYVYKDSEVRFITKSGTKKFDNFKRNAYASMTVVDCDQPIAVDITGRVEQIVNVEEHDETMQQILKVSRKYKLDLPPIVKLHAGGFVSFRLTLKQGKYTDYTKGVGHVDSEYHTF